MIPRVEDGLINYSDGSWTRTTGKSGLLRRAGTRRIRGIEQEAASEVDRATSSLNLPFAVRSFIVFLHAGAEMEVREAPELVTHIKKLKSAIRKLPKAQSLSERQVEKLAADHGFS